MNPALGVMLHAVGGLAAGSFYLPFRRVRGWAWESYWLIQGVLAWVIMPTLAAVLTTPDVWHVLASSPRSSLALAYLFGVLWGVGGLTFGLSMRYLGMSLGYALALGFCAAFGTLLSAVFEGRGLELATTRGGLTVSGGIAVCLAAIAVCGCAGVRRERELADAQKRATMGEYALGKGFLVAVFAGVMSACMALGITAGKPIAQAALDAGAPDLYKNNPVFIVVMAGGFTTNALWCLVLNVRSRSLHDYVRRPASVTRAGFLANYVLSGLAGVIWYLQFFFYGMGTTRMGRYDFASWTIHMAFVIFFSNLWGLWLREWKNTSPKTGQLVFAGLMGLVASTVIIGLGNWLAQ